MADPENDRSGRPAGSPVRPSDPVDDLQTEHRERDKETAGAPAP
jgi:hypothetical protein